MPFQSPHPRLDIPQCNLLTHIFGDDPSNPRTNPRNGSKPDDPVWIDARDPSKSLNRYQTLQWARRMGFGLQRLGLGKDDVVMLCTPNHIYIPTAYLGTVGAGCIFSGANPTYTVPELVHQLSNTGAKVVLAHPAVLKNILAAADKVGFPKNRVYQFSDEANPIRDGVQDWRTMLGTPAEGDSWQWPRFSPREAAENVATINFSSGTTGLPKGVCISHANLIANIEQSTFAGHAGRDYSATSLDRPEGRWIGFLPLYHAYGQLYIIILALMWQNKVWVTPEFKFDEYLDLIQKHKITTLHVVPPILILLSKRPEVSRYDLSSVTQAMCGAAPLSRELQNAIQARFGISVKQGWGMTELVCGGTGLPGGEDDDTGSVGYLLPNCECKLLDEDGKEVGVGEAGEMYMRGPNVCMRYWRNEEATRESLSPDGWFKTGDVALRNEKGYMWIVDRKKELIKVNGLQVAPAELEAVLLENEHVADVAAAGIIIDESEWPRAYVVLQEASKGKVRPSDIQDWIAPRVAKHKRLVGGVMFVDEVPKLASGKIQRKVTRVWTKRDAAELQKKTKARL